MNIEKIDVLIKGAKVFHDGLDPVVEDVAIVDGKISKRGADLGSITKADKVIDAKGLWLMPGLFDVHTHYDLELEVAPALPESIRHGTTTVVIANCSLGLAFGAQRRDGFDPIVSCYARVENIPKKVLRDCADKVDWNTPQEYLEHLQDLKKGPNVVTLLPHSMLRIEAMGFENSVSRDPTDAEIANMQSILRDSLRSGYAGFSTDALPFHYLANQPMCHKTIPTQFAKFGELKKLTSVVREENSLWQATPPKDSAIQTARTFLLTSGRLYGKPLRTTVVAALDVSNNRRLVGLARQLSKILNSKLVKGQFYMQALGARFKTWSDGALTPLAEEIPELRALNETDLEDREARMKILSDPEYIKAFKSMWMKGKQGFSLARLRRLIRVEDYAFDRDFEQMSIDVCPFKDWEGKTFQEVFDRVLDLKQGGNLVGGSEESELISKDFYWVADEADFMLQMLRTFDTELSWSTVTANRDLKVVRKLLMDPLMLPGFNDSGAHLTNMAFYDANLRSLKLAAEGGDKDVSYMVKRLSKDAAQVFAVDRGTLYEGDVADLILVDPSKLKDYDGEAQTQRVFREEFNHQQLVNRSDGVVPLVLVNGQTVCENGTVSDTVGTVDAGVLLKPHVAEAA